MNFMLSGGYVEGGSPVHRMDALVRLLCLLFLLGAVIFCDTLPGYALILGMLFLAVRGSGMGLGSALQGVRRMWLFFGVIFLMNVLFSQGEEPLFCFWIFRISREGAAQGIHVVLHVVLAMVLARLLVATTPPLELVGAVESLIFPLKYVGVPVQDVAMILGIAIQFIPTFAREAEMIQKAQTARGACFDSRNFLKKARSVLPLVVPVFLSAFRRADELAVSMEARGYRRAGKRAVFRKRRLCAVDGAFLLLSVLFCVLEIIL